MKFKVEKKEIEGETWYKFNKEYERIRYYRGNLIMAILGILTILFMIFLTYYVLTNVNELTENPLVYGLSKLDVETICQCNILDEQYIDFWVNSTHISLYEETTPLLQDYSTELFKNITIQTP